MNSDQLKAAAEKYVERKYGINLGSMYDRHKEAYIAGAELMRAEITELERKLSICVGALEKYVKADEWKERDEHFDFCLEDCEQDCDEHHTTRKQKYKTLLGANVARTALAEIERIMEGK